MRVEDFYSKTLAIESPWGIADVRLDQQDSAVHLTLMHEEGIC